MIQYVDKAKNTTFEVGFLSVQTAEFFAILTKKGTYET